MKKEAAVTFKPTGSKEVGEKAQGKIVFRNCESSGSITIPSGTGISARGKTYITQTTVSVPGGQGGFGGCTTPGVSKPVDVAAQEIGEDYNVDEGTQFSVAGRPNSSNNQYFRAVADTDIAGGSKRTVAIVTEGDVSKAIDRLKSENTDGVKQQLEGMFGEEATVLSSTFVASEEGVASVPAVNEQVKDEGEARLAGTLVFSMLGVEKKDLASFLEAFFNEQIKDQDNQRVYDSGAEKANFIDVVAAADNSFTATMTATAKFGPKIDDANVKAQAKGKKFGDVQAAIEQISGVENVDVRFSPFWVRTVPDDENRITIEFNLDETKESK